MRFCLLFILPLFAPLATWSQSDLPSNSFEGLYKKTNPSIIYKYDSLQQIHNYSNNWDFDKDGKPDQVYFVGTGGAHLYYFLRVILSTDSHVRDFSSIQSDLPMLASDEVLRKQDFMSETNSAPFAVFDYDNDNAKDILVTLDNSSFDIGKKSLHKKGIKTNLVLLTFKDGNAIFKIIYSLAQ